MKFAHTSFLVDVVKAKENGILETQFGSIPVFEDDLILTDVNGKMEVMSQSVFNKRYVPVEEVVVKGDSASLYEAAYKEFSLDSQEEDDLYLDGTAELNGIKHTYWKKQ